MVQIRYQVVVEDIITGNGGIDSLAGGEGDDTFVFTSDLAASDTISGGVSLETASVEPMMSPVRLTSTMFRC